MDSTGQKASTQQIARRYDRWSSVYDLAEAVGPLSLHQRRWRRRAVERIRDVSGWVLDAACGTGIMIPDYEKQLSSVKVIAVDASPKMAERARQRAKQSELDVCVLLADVRRLPFKEGSLDAVVCTYSITTVGGPGRAVSEFERVLSDGSRLVVLDSERPNGLLAGALYRTLIPISRYFCHSHIDRDVNSLLEGRMFLRQEGRTAFLGGMVAINEYSKTVQCAENG
jgi:ubiquinone/menaquinone biosynthesis C-methylase UbiE